MANSRITFEGNTSAAEEVAEFASSCLSVVTGMKNTLGLDRMMKVFDAPNGAQVYVLDYEHIQRVHIVAPPLPDEEVLVRDIEEEEEEEFLGVPDFVSGIVTSPIVEEVEVALPGDDPNKPTPLRKVIKGVRQTETSAQRIPFDIARIKLGVDELPEMRRLPNPNMTRYSEHANIQPGFYSGAMRPLVQLMLGVGVVHRQTYESRWVKEGEGARAFIKPDSSKKTRASEFGLYKKNGKGHTVAVRWDYRFACTHGISWGIDGRAYVVEISTKGLFVTPLEVDPLSLDEAGRKRYQELYPELFDFSELREYGMGGSVFNVFGGFPTGNYVPTGTALHEELVKAGERVQVLTKEDMEEFYSKQGYSSSMGWTFHPRGGEAHNTCHEVLDGAEHWGYHYCATFLIGEYREPTPNDRADEVIALLGLTGFKRRKALRLGHGDISDILWKSNIEDARAAFEAIEVSAPFKAYATLKLQKKGRLWGFPPDVVFPCKVPEPLIAPGAVVTVVFQGLSGDENRPKCDTPIFVCYGPGGELNVVNFFLRTVETPKIVSSSTRGECQVDGGWSEKWVSEGEALAGNFYSNVADWRRMVSIGSKTERHYFGEQIGQQSRIVFFGEWGGWEPDARAHLHWIFHYVTDFNGYSLGGEGLTIGVVVPFGDRNIYYMTKTESETDRVDVVGSLGNTSASGNYRLPVLVVGPYKHADPSQGKDGWGPWWWGMAYGRGGYKYVYPGMIIHLAPFDGNPGVAWSPTPMQFGEPEISEGCGRDDAIGVGAVPYDTRNYDAVHAQAIFGPKPADRGAFERKSKRKNKRSILTKIFGDTRLHGKTVNEEEAEATYPETADLKQGRLWLRRSPDAYGSLTYCAITASYLGRRIFCYDPDDGEGWRSTEGDESMRAYWSQCYVGWIE